MALSISIKIGLSFERKLQLPEVLAYLSIGTGLSLWAIKLGDRPCGNVCVCVCKGAVEFLIIMYYLKSSVCGYFYHPISKLKSSFFVCLHNKKN